MSKLILKDKFAQTPNGLLHDKKVSLKAKGLYAFIQSKSDGWNFSAKRISYELKEGVQSVSSCLRELEQSNYLERVKYQNNKGHWEIDYILHYIPYTKTLLTETRTQENPQTENPINGKPTNIKKKDIRKKDIINKEDKKEGLDFNPLSDNFKKNWDEWIEYKKKQHKFEYADLRYEQKAFNKLVELSGQNENQAQKIIEDSIANGWKGFFPRNEKKGFEKPKPKLDKNR